MAPQFPPASLILVMRGICDSEVPPSVPALDGLLLICFKVVNLTGCSIFVIFNLLLFLLTDFAKNWNKILEKIQR